MKGNEALEYLKKANRQNDMLGILPGSDIGKTLIKALEEVQQYRELTDRLKAICGDQITLKIMVDAMENVIRDLGYKHPVIARILTCNEAIMWDEYRKVGTPEECLRNKDFLDFLSDKMDPDDFEMYLRIYNLFDEKGESHD